MLMYVVLIIVILSILLIKIMQSYWLRQGVLEIQPQFFTGNVLEIVTYKKSWGQLILQFYNEFKSKGVKYGGIYFFLKPTLISLDPQIIKDILVNSFQCFVNRGIYYNKEYEPISANIVSLEDKAWKALRVRMLLLFTPNQIKNMFQTFETHTDKLSRSLVNHWKKNESVDIHKLAASFTTDITASCLLGMESKCLENPQCKFFEQGKKITEITWQKSLTLILAQLFPRKVCGILGMRFTDKDVQTFFLEKASGTMNSKDKNNHTWKNIPNVMQAKNRKQENDQTLIAQNGYGVNEIAAQCFVAFIAGHETTATVLKFSLYELAINQKVQDVLRNEIDAILKMHDGELSCETISEMEYLDGVVLETLRKHPVCPVLLRNCNSTYRVPKTNITLNKGTLVKIPVIGLHMDPEYHPNPESFNPERFNKENRKFIKEFTFMPFGGGPRGCLGGLPLYSLPLIYRENLYIQLDGAPIHNAAPVRRWPNENFQDKWIGRNSPFGAWPPRSGFLSVGFYQK